MFSRVGISILIHIGQGHLIHTWKYSFVSLVSRNPRRSVSYRQSKGSAQVAGTGSTAVCIEHTIKCYCEGETKTRRKKCLRPHLITTYVHTFRSLRGVDTPRSPADAFVTKTAISEVDALNKTDWSGSAQVSARSTAVELLIIQLANCTVHCRPSDKKA